MSQRRSAHFQLKQTRTRNVEVNTELNEWNVLVFD